MAAVLYLSRTRACVDRHIILHSSASFSYIHACMYACRDSNAPRTRTLGPKGAHNPQ